MLTFLVLGSAGLIGTSFSNLVLSLNHKVIRWDKKDGPEYDLCDTKNLTHLKRSMLLSDYVIFTAYDIGGSKFLDKWDNVIIDNNIKIMSNVFGLLADVKRPFIFLSSHMSNLLDSAYGTCKRIGEFYTTSLGGINTRLWNVYGYEADVSIRSHVCIDFVDMALSKQKIRVLSSGHEEKQFLYVDDCSNALYTLCTHYNEFKYSTVDISSYEWISIQSLAEKIADKCNCENIEYSNVHNFNLEIRNPLKSRLNELWTPKISLDTGLDIIITQYKNYKLYNEVNDNTEIVNKINTKILDILNISLSGTNDSDQHLLTLFSMVIQTKAKRILELGVRKGTTTLPLLLGCSYTEGHVTSVDINPTTFVCPEYLKSRWNFVESDAISFLDKDKVNNSEPWDLIYLDDFHAYQHVKKELEILDYRVSPKSIILIHDCMYNTEPFYHSDLTLDDGQWAGGGPYRAVAELNKNFWEFSTIPVCNGLTILRKKYSSLPSLKNLLK